MLRDRTTALAALVLVGVGLVLVDTARSLSATYDEPAILGCGVAYVQRREVRLGREHPPLAKLAIGATLTALGVREGPAAAAIYTAIATPSEGDVAQHPYGEALLARDCATFSLPGARPGAHAIVTAARLVVIPFALLLVAVAFLWGRSLAGPRGGFVAMALAATYPDLLGHGALATLDVPVAALGLLAAYALERRLSSGPGDRRAWGSVVGVALGAALATKLTALLLLPALGVVALLGAPRESAARRALLRDGATALALAAVVVASVYALSGGGPLGFLEAARVRAETYKDMGASRSKVCLDTFAPSFPHYFVVASALKLPAGTLVLLAVAVLAARRERQPLARELAWLVPGAALFAGTSLAGQPLGSRYVLPALPFFFVGAARLGRWATTRPRQAVLLLALAANVAGVAREHPFHQSATNALAGPPETFHRLLDDSNQDWGGGFLALAEWQRENAVAPLVVVGHATAFSFRHFEDYGVRAERRLGDVLLAPQPGRVYAVSADVVSHMRARERARPGSPPLVLGGSVRASRVVGGGLLIFDLR